MYDLNNFYTNGFCIIDDFLKDDLSKSLLSEFKTIKDWDRVDQVRNHYEKGGPFEMESIYFLITTKNITYKVGEQKTMNQVNYG